MEDQQSNKVILSSLKQGDMSAFDSIYKIYSSRLYSFVLRYIKQKEDAREIVQEVFIKIWESRSNIDLYSSFESFLFTITYNSAISLLRKRVSERKYLEHLKLRTQIDQTPEITSEIEFQELNFKIELLLNQLTPRQKEIFQLSRVEGLTHGEIAKKLDISSNTVKNHMVAALSFLKSKLDNTQILNLLFACLFLAQ